MTHRLSIPLFTIALASLGLVALGLIGIARGDELSSVGEYAPRQFLWLILSLVVLSAAVAVPYRVWSEYAFVAFLSCLILLVVVFFLPARNGARRWIPVGPMSLQPSELMKLAYIVALSRYLMFRKNQRTIGGLIVPFLMTTIPVLLIVKEPDLGTSLLFFPVLFAILFAAGAKRRHLIITICAGIAFTPVLWKFMSAEQKSRVTAVFTQEDGGKPKTGDGYHLHQSKQLIALGGTWGSSQNPNQEWIVDDPAAYRLPAGRTDFVYCLIGERYGVPGTLGVLILYSILISAGMVVATRTRDPFGRLLAVGIVTMMGVQAVINTAMTVGLAPITGLTLPFLSYGGSSLLITAISLGLLLNVALRPGYDLAGQPFSFR